MARNTGRKKLRKALFLFMIVALTAGGCGDGGGGSNTGWTWISGSDIVNEAGIYGTKGVTDSTNIPGSRYGSVSWIDDSGDLWLYGGYGHDVDGDAGRLNDLWKFDGENWTWVSGQNFYTSVATYGEKGVADSANKPGRREYSTSWTDSSGNLWLFGGYSYCTVEGYGHINDLWKFDGENWTWVSGSNTVKQTGTYGTKGTADSANMPGARAKSVSWIDASGNVWIFGGRGYDSEGTQGQLNDLWKFDGENWTWVSGSDTCGQYPTYGTKGVADSDNVPGGRENSVGWIDSSGNLWLFGGYGHGVSYLSDLWKFDGENWTWVSGGNSGSESGIYGTRGTADSANMPGGRYGGVSWIDDSGNLWLFGGYGYDSAGNSGRLNDLWKFDGESWTWVSGSDTEEQIGTYGTKGTTGSSNVPGARNDSISWIDDSGNLWLFGGSTDNSSRLNDLWRYKP